MKVENAPLQGEVPYTKAAMAAARGGHEESSSGKGKAGEGIL